MPKISIFVSSIDGWSAAWESDAIGMSPFVNMLNAANAPSSYKNPLLKFKKQFADSNNIYAPTI